MFKMDASKLGVKKYICTECDESYTETIDALGHKYVDTVIKPTESESGYTLHNGCVTEVNRTRYKTYNQQYK